MAAHAVDAIHLVQNGTTSRSQGPIWEKMLDASFDQGGLQRQQGIRTGLQEPAIAGTLTQIEPAKLLIQHAVTFRSGLSQPGMQAYRWAITALRPHLDCRNRLDCRNQHWIRPKSLRGWTA